MELFILEGIVTGVISSVLTVTNSRVGYKMSRDSFKIFKDVNDLSGTAKEREMNDNGPPGSRTDRAYLYNKRKEYRELEKAKRRFGGRWRKATRNFFISAVIISILPNFICNEPKQEKVPYKKEQEQRLAHTNPNFIYEEEYEESHYTKYVNVGDCEEFLRFYENDFYFSNSNDVYSFNNAYYAYLRTGKSLEKIICWNEGRTKYGYYTYFKFVSTPKYPLDQYKYVIFNYDTFEIDEIIKVPDADLALFKAYYWDLERK